MNINDTIRSAGLKVTPQRRLVYEVIRERGHILIEDITQKVHSINPEITVSTIYRIVDSFCENNLIKRLYCVNGKTYYDITTTDHSHIINAYQELIDLDDPELKTLIRNRIADKIRSDETIDKITIQITTKK